MTPEKVYAMPFGKIRDALLSKALRKGRTEEEFCQVVQWLTGYSPEALQSLPYDLPYGDFFLQAPCLNPDRVLITGTICGIRVETIEEPLMREIRRLDKLVDELARGRAMEKILRKP